MTDSELGWLRGYCFEHGKYDLLSLAESRMSPEGQAEICRLNKYDRDLGQLEWGDIGNYHPDDIERIKQCFLDSPRRAANRDEIPWGIDD